ncbi:SdiA-regulated domain-containing protein [Solirubrobacter sp. CPCC 204708]|uniref:SdiA-regulated domain-containing protein n=1 Tax=Solirubrobacter deserti TaxID=2282478 RepID=A0ABT4RQ11_9ACTN|nr:SdiA-regulated domain-containing protein [Solirubrobacter deserti]MBE2320597.1 SdiA-regulated domain-containing protein [Solirubrobacter deserti]MDA0140652.1 SdiA-regulated domain-containing protein [Solirubrobacter deserti]
MTKRRALAAVVGAAVFAAPAPALAAVDLSSYVRVGRFDLPEPTRTTPPAGCQLAAEASAITYNAATDSLFLVGDESTCIVQVSKTGQLIDTMNLASGAFDDTEGLTAIGGGQFVLAEERARQLNRFTYAPNTTLTRANVQSVKLGTTIGNEGFEGLSSDPFSNGFVVVKEVNPQGVFQTTVDWLAGTASNGSPTAENSTNLFDPAGLQLLDIADVQAQADGQLLILSQESGKLVNATRTGTVTSSLNVGTAAEGHEGVTIDGTGRIYVVNELGGGANTPQLWVYAPSGQGGPNQAPTAVTLTNPVTSVSSTATRVKVADIVVSDDAQGTNTLSVTGADAAAFEIDGGALYLKAGTPLDRTSFSVAVAVDDATVGTTPDATSATLTVSVSAIAVTEAAPWSSGESPVGADWFEVTNRGTTPVDLTGWKVDDSSNNFNNALVLNGVGVVAPGESVLFTEGTAAKAAELRAHWGLPASVQIGYYSGSGIGLSTDGDAVNLFNAAGARVTGFSFGASTNGFTFENVTGVQLSVAGVNGAFTRNGETGSPGTIAPRLAVTEASPWSSGNSPYQADWFEVTNLGANAVSLAGFKVDDSSNAFASAIALNGVTTIAAGESALFIEGTAAKAEQLRAAWGLAPSIQIGFYSGSGIGLSTDGDAVWLFDPTGTRVGGFAFGASTIGFTFENVNGVKLSAAGVNGAFLHNGEVGSPGRIAAPYSEVKTDATIVAEVPPQLGLTLGAPVKFAPFIAGVANEYTASTTLNVISTAGEATLSMSDPGHLTNGAFQLAQPLQVTLSKTAWTAPVSNDVVDVVAKQAVGKNDPLRTGSYSKTITFTLSTTNP